MTNLRPEPNPAIQTKSSQSTHVWVSCGQASKQNEVVQAKEESWLDGQPDNVESIEVRLDFVR
jgi:hypothetical protein